MRFIKNGIEHNGKMLVKPNNEEAFKLYNMVRDEDTYGVCDWLIGWQYQNNYMDAAKKLSVDKRLEEAKKFYESSAKKGYPKAINSLGNFYKYGWGGLEQNETIAASKYTEAAKLNDPYALLNCGHEEMRNYEYTKNISCLTNAFNYFSQATQYNSAEGWLYLGIVYEEKAKNDALLLEHAKECYINSTCNVRNQFSAMGFYKLGSLVSKFSQFKNDNDIKKALSPIRFNDLTVECYTKSYELFQEIQSNGATLSDTYRHCFENLVQGFKNID